MNIRQIDTEDWPKVYRLMQEASYLENFPRYVYEEKVKSELELGNALFLLAEVNGEVAGVIIGAFREVRGESLGYVKWIAVNREYRLRGIGKALVSEVENYYRTNNKIDVLRLGDVPKNYLQPGVDPLYTPMICLAERMGFIRFDTTVNMSVDLNQDWSTEKIEQELFSQNVIIKRADKHESELILNWIRDEFLLWEYEVVQSYNGDPIALHLAIKNKKVIAFSAYDGNNRGTAWFGPMGTTSECRGLGIGNVLLKRCLYDMKQLGFKKSTIPWVGPIPFYAKYTDARVERVFWRYEKRYKSTFK